MRSQEVTFTPTQREFNISVPIVDDNIVEATENFIVRADLVSTDALGVMINPQQSTVTILDTDSE